MERITSQCFHTRNSSCIQLQGTQLPDPLQHPKPFLRPALPFVLATRITAATAAATTATTHLVRGMDVTTAFCNKPFAKPKVSCNCSVMQWCKTILQSKPASTYIRAWVEAHPNNHSSVLLLLTLILAGVQHSCTNILHTSSWPLCFAITNGVLPFCSIHNP